jgi:hypothetical protein
VPGTNVAVWWQATHKVTVQRRGSLWDLSPLVRPGQVRAWAKLADRPQLGPWPITPLPSRTTYRSRTSGTTSTGHHVPR